MRRSGAPIALVTCIAFLAETLPSTRVLAQGTPAEGAPAARAASEERAAAPVVDSDPVAGVGMRPATAADRAAKADPNARLEGSASRAATRSPVVGSAAAVAARSASEGAYFQSLGAATQGVDSVTLGGASNKTGVSSQAIALPQGAGKVQGMGESFSTQLSTGVATFTVPITLPDARGSAQPTLALTYNSSAGHGLAGVGWDASTPSISRQTDRGLPQYDDRSAWHPGQDRFLVGSADLVPVCSVQGTSCTGSLPGEVMPAWAGGWQYFRLRVE
ncbi:MAG TPA: SpvB/TcaC N-terminal domain-containing protein, partial [Polyangiaceae bacterium]|nr:SpvB/TcaC N-terminal domain-containing protein [Polyangiaceae bacterium]